VSLSTRKPVNTLSRVEERSGTFRLGTAAELGDGLTSGLDRISEFVCVQLDIPSTDRADSVMVRLYPTDRPVKFVAAVLARKAQTPIREVNHALLPAFELPSPRSVTAVLIRGPLSSVLRFQRE